MKLGRFAAIALPPSDRRRWCTGLADEARAHRCAVHAPAARPDILARTYGQKLQEYWGQPVIVDNRPGAGGTIGTGIVAKSPARRLHRCSCIPQRTRSIPSMYPDLPFDTLKDFVEIAPLGGQPNVLVVAPSVRHQVRRGPDRAGEARIRASSTTRRRVPAAERT